MSDNRPQQSGPVDQGAARRNARVVALIAVIAILIAFGVGFAANLLKASHDGHHYNWVVAVLIFVAVFVLMLAIVLPLTLRLLRRPSCSRVLQYSWSQRRRVGKALRKGWPIAPHDRPVANALVRTMRPQRWLHYLYGVILLVYVVQALFDHGFLRWLAIVLVALYVVLFPWVLRQRRTIFANYTRLEPSADPSTPR